MKVPNPMAPAGSPATEAAPEGSDDVRLRVLSWNVHGLPFHSSTPQRLARIAAVIRERRPDLVLLQEVWAGRYRRLFERALASEYDLVSAVRPLLRSPRGGLLTLLRRESGWGAAPPIFTTYAASAPRLRLTEGDGVSGKGILSVELRRGAGVVVALNTHLQAGYGERRYADVRQAQLQQLGVAAAAAAGRALILGGDLNTEPEESLYGSHLAPLGEDLTADERRRTGGGTCFDAAGVRREWIDYLIAHGVRRLISFERLQSDAPDDPYSDHDGLLAYVAL